MNARRGLSAIVIAMTAAWPAATVRAQLPVTLSGGLGIDVDGYSFERTMLEDNSKSDVTRSLTFPYLDLQSTGPLLDEDLADYMLGLRFSGTSYRAESTEDGIDNGGTGLGLSAYRGRLTLFGARSYPVAAYASRAEVPSLRYEVGNRAESDLDNPALAVIRRYDSVLDRRGAVWKAALPRSSDLSLEMESSETITRRNFDFGEDRDIYVSFTTIRPDETAFLHRIEIRNEIPLETIQVFIDGALVRTLAGGAADTLSLENGTYTTRFVPQTLNAFRASVRVNGEAQWKIVQTPPPGAQDIEQTSDVVRAAFAHGEDDARFQTEAVYEYNDSRDDVQRIDSLLRSFNNAARYQYSTEMRFESLTTITSNRTDIEAVSSQATSSVLQQTGARWQRRRGPSAQLLHSFARSSSETDVSSTSSTTNTVSGSGKLPTEWHGHELRGRVNATLLDDNLGYSSRQYTAEMENKLWLRNGPVVYEPRQLLKYGTSSRKNPDGSSREMESQSSVVGEVLDAPLGQVRFKGELNYRRRRTEAGAASTTKYLGELGVTKEISKQLAFGLSTSQQMETYGGGAGSSLALETQVQRSYRANLQGAWGRVFTGSLSAVLVTSKDIRTRRFSGALSVNVPRPHIPIRSSLLSETRSLTGQPDQSLFQVETRASYNFRSVRLTLNHTFVRDRQLTEEYRYQELLATIARNFHILGGGS